MTDSSGNSLNGTYQITFRLYTAASGGSAVWEETQDVSVTDGLLSAMLGEEEDLSMTFSKPYWLTLEIAENGESDGEMTPRIQLASSAYSMGAKYLEGVSAAQFLRSDEADTMAGTLTFGNNSTNITTEANKDLTINPTGTGSVVINIDSASTGFKLTDGTTDWFVVGDDGNITSISDGGSDLFNVKVGNLKVGDGTPNITMDGEDFFVEGNAGVGGNMTIAGNLTVDGTINGGSGGGSSDSTNSLTFTVDADNTGGTEPATGAGFVIEGGSGDVSLTWDAANDTLDVSHGVAVTGSLATSAAMTAGTDLTVTSGMRVGTGSAPDNLTALEDDSVFVEGDVELDGTLYGVDATFTGTITADSLSITGQTVGDITGVTAGAGLTGGGDSGAVTLNVAAANGSITVNADSLSVGTIDATYISTDILSSLDGVTNDGGNIDLVAGTGISITPNDGANTITIASTVTDTDTDTFASIEVNGAAVSTNAPTLDFDGTDFTLTENPADSFDVTLGATVTKLGQTINAVEMADEDHGDISWSGGVASVDADVLDFDNLADTLTLDAATEIDLGGVNLTIDLDSTGDFVIKDGGTATHIFADSGDVGIGTTSPTARLHGVDTLGAATGDEVAYRLEYTTNKATSGNDTGLLISMTDTASPGTSLPLDIKVGGSSVWSLNNAGQLTAGDVPWGRLSSVPAGIEDGDDDTTYSAGTDLDLTGTTFSLETTLDSVETINLAGTGTLNGLDAIDATTEATLEAALDIGGDVTGTGLSNVTIAANAVALGTDTTGNYVDSLTEGLAIDVSGSAGEGWSPTVAFDPTELIGSRTWGDGSTDTIVWTWDRLSSGDVAVTLGGGDFNVTTGNLQQAGNTVLTTATSFSGDLSGAYNNLQLGSAVVDTTELADASVTKEKFAELAASIDGAPDKTVAIAAGRIYANGNTLINFSATDANFASGGNCVYTPVASGKYVKGIIVLSSAGVLSCTFGSEQNTAGDAEGSSVTYPTDKIPVAEVILKTTGTTAGAIANIEASAGTESYLYRDVRPFLNISGATGVTGFSKSGETVLTGNVTLSGSGAVTLTQIGQNIEISATEGGGGDVLSTGTNTFTANTASPILLRPGSAPSANTKLFDVQTTGTTTSVASIDAEGDAVLKSLTVSTAITDDNLAQITTAGKVADSALSSTVTKLGQTINAAEMADEDHGDISWSSGVASVDANAVALGTDTTGNYVATVADGGSGHLTVGGSGSETAAVTLSVAADALNFSELADTLTLDAATEIDLGGVNLTIDLDSTGDFVIKDGGTATHIFADSGDVGIGTTSPTARLHGVDTLGAATGDEVAYRLDYTTNKATSGSDTGLLISMTDTASPGTSLPLDIKVGGSSVYSVNNAGQLTAGDVPWGRLSSVPAGIEDGDDDTTYSAGTDLDLTGTTFSLETTLDSVETINLAGTGTLTGLDAIDATTEATLEAALDIGGDVTGTGLSNVTIAANAVALGTDTTGNYVATVADGGSGHLTVGGSGSETAAVTLSVAADALNFSELSDSLVLDATTTIDLDSNTADLNFDGGTLYLDNAGMVGIGTTSPGSLLDLEKAGTAKANLDIAELTNSGNAADMDATETSLLFNQWYYDATTPAVADAGRISVGTETDWTSTAATQDSYMAFETALNGTVTEYARLNSVGYFGIGTTVPGAALDIGGGTAGSIDGADDILVAGDVEIDGNLYVDGTITGAVTLSDDSLDFDKFADAMTLDAATGITLGAYDLTINETGAGMLTVASDQLAAGIEINNTAVTGDPTLSFQLSGTSVFTMGVDDSDNDKFKIGTTAVETSTALTIDSSQQIGIGTTAPSVKLDVRDGANEYVKLAPNASGGSGALLDIYSFNARERQFNAYLRGDSHFDAITFQQYLTGTSSAGTSNLLILKNAGTPSAGGFNYLNIKNVSNVTEMVVTDDGYVGIGTSDPQAELDVVGATRLGDSTTNYMAVSSSGAVSYAGSAQPKRTIVLTASGAITVPESGYADVRRTVGTNFVYYSANFDQSTDETAYWEFIVPDSLTGTTAEVTLYWTASGGSATQKVDWEISAAGLTNDEVFDSALGSAVTVNDELIATGDLHVTAAGTLTHGWSAGDFAVLEVNRDADDATNDTLAADAKLIMVKLEWSASAESD